MFKPIAGCAGACLIATIVAAPALAQTGAALPNLGPGEYRLIGASPDTSAPAVVQGEVVRVMWGFGNSEVTLRDSSGALVSVLTDDSDSLRSHGASRDLLRPGTPLTVNGYRADHGGAIFANPMAFSSAGKPLLSGTPSPDFQAETARRAAICGSRPAFADDPAVATMEAFNDKSLAWLQACEAKVSQAGKPGEVVDRSPMTNAVIREGEKEP